jgi:DNA topoisomerase-1
MDKISLAEAIDLFQLPRTLGATAEGDAITTNVGRFGPYVKYGSKYVSLKAEDDPYTITLERALEVIRLKQEADANRIITDFAADGIQVLNGRYGPYVTDKKKNAKIPKDRDPKSLTLEECRALIAQAPERTGGRFGRGKRGGAPAAKAQAATPGDGKAAAGGKTGGNKKRRPAAPANGATQAGAGQPPNKPTRMATQHIAGTAAAAPRAAARKAASKSASATGTAKATGGAAPKTKATAAKPTAGGKAAPSRPRGVK